MSAHLKRLLFEREKREKARRPLENLASLGNGVHYLLTW